MELDDGRRMRRARPRRTARVEQAITDYQALIRHLDVKDISAEAFVRDNALLDAALKVMPLDELKGYYEEIRAWRLSIRPVVNETTSVSQALPEPPVSWD